MSFPRRCVWNLLHSRQSSAHRGQGGQGHAAFKVFSPQCVVCPIRAVHRRSIKSDFMEKTQWPLTERISEDYIGDAMYEQNFIGSQEEHPQACARNLCLCGSRGVCPKDLENNVSFGVQISQKECFTFSQKNKTGHIC